MGQKHAKERAFDGVLPATATANAATASARPLVSSCATQKPQEPAAAAAAPSTVQPLSAVPPHALLSPDASDSSDRFVVPESVRRSQTVVAYEHVCSEILPAFLYVSNLTVAQDRDALAAVGITHVVNCCPEVTTEPAPAALLPTLSLAVRDGVQEDLLPFFYQVTHFIRECEATGRVLVHCHQGISRSCAFAIAYVMFAQRVGYRDAAALVKARRTISSPNAAFTCQLLEWERLLTVAATQTLLYRWAPHAAHDPTTWVLKRCDVPGTRKPIVFADEVPLDEAASADCNPSPTHVTRAQLWSRGLFVFQRGDNVVIWTGPTHQAHPEDAKVPTLVAQMVGLHTQLIETVDADSVDLIYETGDSSALVDMPTELWADYQRELSWAETSATASASPTTDTITAADLERAKPQPKPLLLLLEDSARYAWEVLKSYNSDDLTCEDAFLLVPPVVSASTTLYLWKGRQCIILTSCIIAAARSWLAKRTTLAISVAVTIKLVRQDAEPEEFWTLFEQGY
ncbi:TPA: hypothetical protein N0F65_006593 [Lagenidium giganteum]|uniref:Protein-tyrosine-phosphatase n=1 Tax=Lagenidium giganteum TaxID=4803 RepID=A0AAV2Z5Y0_9STRA|nr:TPA: hypothetical protein N0F65_006593 [Lagenidium giganteum]